MDEQYGNPYAAPRNTSSQRGRTSAHKGGSAGRLVTRLLLGGFGGLFIAAVVWTIAARLTDSWSKAESYSLLAMVAGSIIVACAAYTRSRIVSSLAWCLGGLGVGLVLQSILAGGLGVGTSVTPIGIVISVPAGIFGWRAGVNVKSSS
jgi:hypothetical protein